MTLQIVPGVVPVAIDLFRGLVGETNQGQESVVAIFNSMRDNLSEIVTSEAGQRLCQDVGRLARQVCTEESFRGMIGQFFHLAKQVNWVSSSAVATWEIFLLLIAALIHYIYWVAESTVAVSVWVTNLISDLGGFLANLMHSLKDFVMVVTEFFKRSCLQLVQGQPSASSNPQLPQLPAPATEGTSTNIVVSE